MVQVSFGDSCIPNIGESMKKALLAFLIVPSMAFAMQARVVSSTPVYNSYSYTDNICSTHYEEQQGNGLGTLIGAAIGYSIGKNLPTGGIGSNTTNAVIGGIAGGMTGHAIASAPKKVTTCTPQIKTESRIVGYEVRYRLDSGQEIIRRMDHDPGIGSVRPVSITIH